VPAKSPEPINPVLIGPTWQRDTAGEWILPDRTLGWQVLQWCKLNLRLPDGPDAGAPWDYTDEQARFILWWFAVDANGRWIYRSGMLRRVKGWGKDPVAATLCATELVGPCRFSGEWAPKRMAHPLIRDLVLEKGDPIAIPHPAAWILTAAVAKDQTRNTMTLFPGLFTDEATGRYSLDIGKEIIYAHRGRCRLEAVTSSPRALEGPRPTFTVKNETQHWLANNDGHEMAKVIARNATKSRDGASRVLAISNAHEPGEDSDAEHDYEAWIAIEQGKTRRKGFLYDSLEAPPAVDIADELQLRAALIAARGDSIWLDIDTHVDEIYDTRNSVATSRRFYLNQLVAAEDAWIAPHEWDALGPDATDKQPALEPLQDREQITLGFDGSSADDHCGLHACRISDGAVFTLGVWDPAEHDGEAPRDLIDGAVRNAFGRYQVLAFFSDLHPWESYVDQWAADFGSKLKVKASAKHAIAWDMRTHQKESTIEIERLQNEIVEQKFRHDGDKRTAQHFYNARRWPNRWGVTVRKEHRESARKIDSVPSVMLARLARRMLGPRRRQKPKAAFYE
jgi:hypothetical protein